jgi:hypothetical protein
MKLITVAIAIFCTCQAMFAQTNKQKKSDMEQQAIIQQIKSLFTATDARDWDKVQATMNESVVLDYSSMTGQPAATLSPESIVKAWSAFLPGFDSTHHHVSGFVVKLTGNTAMAHFDGTANHYINNAVWTVQGSYDTKLERKNNQWLISEFKFNFAEQNGNTDLPKLSAERMGRSKN